MKEILPIVSEPNVPERVAFGMPPAALFALLPSCPSSDHNRASQLAIGFTVPPLYLYSVNMRALIEEWNDLRVDCRQYGVTRLAR